MVVITASGEQGDMKMRHLNTRRAQPGTYPDTQGCDGSCRHLGDAMQPFFSTGNRYVFNS